jgi:predicted SpoU family rRNA methylase
MGLPKGITNNREGRPLGALNKITKNLRGDITSFLENNFEEVIKEWQKLEGKEKLTFYRDLLQYAVPKLQSMEMQQIPVNDEIDINSMSTEELILRAEVLRKIEKENSK